MRKVPNEQLNLYRGTRDMLEIALTAALPLIVDQGGLVCEFGVGSGRSMRMTQEILPLDATIHGFDTVRVKYANIGIILLIVAKTAACVSTAAIFSRTK